MPTRVPRSSATTRRPWVGWAVLVLAPVLTTTVAVARPLWEHAARTRAERLAVDFLARVRAVQDRVRERQGQGYAPDLAALSSACSTDRTDTVDVDAVEAAGYVVHVRPTRDARHLEATCGGQPLVTDYLVTVEPRADDWGPRRAYAARRDGVVFVFFDGVAPAERDMSMGGLATPFEALPSLRIP